MRKNITPSTGRRSAKDGQPFVFDTFSRGTIQDPPAGEILDCLADSKNITIYPGYFEGRTGNRLFTHREFPRVEGRIGYSAHKVGDTIVSDSGSIFSGADVGYFWDWGDVCEFIVEYIDGTTVRVENTVYHSGLNCSLVGQINAFFWHNELRKWMLFIGKDLYIAEWNIPLWEKVLIISRDVPDNMAGDHPEYNDYYILFNSKGMFKVEANATYKIAYRVNIDPPETKIKEVPYFVGAAHRYKYLYSAQRLQSCSGIIDRQTPSVISLETGTNLPDSTNEDRTDIYTVEEISSSNPQIVRGLYVPLVQNTVSQERQWHLDTFPIWRSMDLEGFDSNDVNKEKFNDPNRLVWAKDLRMCAAFYGAIIGNIFYALSGEFEVADTHSILELEDGQRYEILRFIDSTTIEISCDYYDYGAFSSICAAAIGNGRVIRGSVTGDILTRTHGSTFVTEDLRKTVWNSSGYRLYITEVISQNQVRVHLNGDMAVQGFTMDPVSRNFYDTIDDKMLSARMDFYSCYSRYKMAMPSCNLGVIIDGFVVSAYRGKSTLYYSTLQSKQDFLIGQYVALQSNEDINDAIQLLRVFPDVLAIISSSSTRSIQIGLSEFITLPGSGEALALLPGVKVVDEHIGCMDIGSVADIENGMINIITNEPGGEAGRQFNGSAYSADNFLVDASLGGRIEKLLRATKRMSVSIYDGFLGYIFWRKNS